MASVARRDLCSSSAASHAHMPAMTTQQQYSAQKKRETPVSTPSQENDSATTVGATVQADAILATRRRRAASSMNDRTWTTRASSPSVATRRPETGALYAVARVRQRNAPSSAMLSDRYTHDRVKIVEHADTRRAFLPHLGRAADKHRSWMVAVAARNTSSAAVVSERSDAAGSSE